jgi:hypothetical protein
LISRRCRRSDLGQEPLALRALREGRTLLEPADVACHRVEALLQVGDARVLGEDPAESAELDDRGLDAGDGDPDAHGGRALARLGGRVFHRDQVAAEAARGAECALGGSGEVLSPVHEQQQGRVVVLRPAGGGAWDCGALLRVQSLADDGGDG